MAHFVEVSTLPDALQSALRSLGYGRKDVAIDVRETVSVTSLGGSGYRCFACIVDLGTGHREVTYGSWGGANMFNPDNRVDLDTTAYPIPENVAVITGSEGGSKPVYASITIGPANAAKLLPPAPEVTDRDRKILAIFGGVKGGHRTRYLTDAKVVPGEIDSLVARGFLTRNRAGAIAVTTAGRNARGNVSVW